MTKKSLLIWIILFCFGFASMPEFGFSNETKQAGKTELIKKRKPKKKSVRKHKTTKKRKVYKKKRKVYKKKRKVYKKKRKVYKKKRYSKRKKSSRRKRTARRYYSPSTNSGSVEYRNYKRNTEGENSQEIEKIAPEKEFKKEPKKDE